MKKGFCLVNQWFALLVILFWCDSLQGFQSTILRQQHSLSAKSFLSSAARTNDIVVPQEDYSKQQQQQDAPIQSKRIVEKGEKIPFIIDRLPANPSKELYVEISEMCIEAFFNDNNNNEEEQQQKTPVWKRVQLSYLRKLQQGDLERRKLLSSSPDGNPNEMFVARRVVPVDSPLAQPNTPLIADMDQIHHHDNKKWCVRGDILGFCEISMRHFGLGEPYDDESVGLGQRALEAAQRPLLTNLAVKAEARQSGIGSALVQACQDVIQTSPIWNHCHEIILEVDQDNQRALDFYSKRGYHKVFDNPTGRRFNTDGLQLTKERVTRTCMRKVLDGGDNQKETTTTHKKRKETKVIDLEQLFFADPSSNVPK